MRADKSSNVTVPSPATPHRPCARSSIAMLLVSTFHAQRATPAASVAIRRWFASHTGGVVPCDDIMEIPLIEEDFSTTVAVELILGEHAVLNVCPDERWLRPATHCFGPARFQLGRSTIPKWSRKAHPHPDRHPHHPPFAEKPFRKPLGGSLSLPPVADDVWQRRGGTALWPPFSRQVPGRPDSAV